MDSEISAPSSRYRHTGLEVDQESALSYHTTRFYSTALARWTSRDSITPIDELNCYAYARCEPAARLDRSGQDSMPESEIQRQLTPTQIRFIDEQRRKYLPDLQVLSVPKQEAMLVIGTLPNGQLYLGRNWDFAVRMANRQVQAERIRQTMSNITGGPAGAIGYLAGGERGSDLGALVDAASMILQPHPANSQTVVGAPLSASQLHVSGAPTHAYVSSKTNVAQRRHHTLRMAFQDVVSKLLGDGSPARTIIGGMSMKSWAKNVLIGTSPSQFRENALRLILSVENHPLRVLLNESNQFYNSAGISLENKQKDPRIAEAGHLVSNFAVASDKQMIVFMSAYENQVLSNTAEAGLKAAQLQDRTIVNVGGVALTESYARDLADAFPEIRDAIAKAPRVSF